ncbi:MAG: hypothetical protein R6X02_07590 [Enhygromyxa sp.]
MVSLSEVERSSTQALAHGGSIYEFTRRLSLDPDHLRTRAWLILATVALAWVPLVILAVVTKLSSGEMDPLLLRAEPHARLLGTLSLLCFAEPVLDARVAVVADGVGEDGLLRPTSVARWNLAIATFKRRRDAWLFDSIWAAAIYGGLLLAYLGGLPDWAARWLLSTLHGVSWSEASAAWWWYVLVAQPLLLWALGRWLVRWVLWVWLLWRLARLELELRAVHGDRAGGLGFTSIPLDSLQLFILALGIAFASVWYDEIAAGRAQISNFTGDVLAFLVLCLTMTLLPYLQFSPKLIRVREAGIVEYAALMRDYAVQFEQRWLGPARPRAQLLGHVDLSGLADLRSSSAEVEAMRSLIPSARDLRSVLLVAALPFVVVALAQGPSAAQLLSSALRRFLAG